MYRLITDQVGSVRLVENTSTGAVAERIDYDEFGNVLADSAPGFQPFGFAGGLRDIDTGLTRFGARDYDSVTGRWTTKDPLGFTGDTANVYEYLGGDPINYSDPWGLLRYNMPPPKTVPPSGPTLESLQCTEMCLRGRTGNLSLDLLITGAAEKSGHSKNSHHYSGQACDIGGPRWNPVSNTDVLECAALCGFGAGYFEAFPGNPNRDHWHLQREPGNGVPILIPPYVPIWDFAESRRHR